MALAAEEMHSGSSSNNSSVSPDNKPASNDAATAKMSKGKGSQEGKRQMRSAREMGRKRKANDGASTEGETETAEPAQTQLQQRMQQSWTNRTRREQEMKRWSCSRLTD